MDMNQTVTHLFVSAFLKTTDNASCQQKDGSAEDNADPAELPERDSKDGHDRRDEYDVFNYLLLLWVI